MQKLLRFLFSKRFIVCVLAVFQLAFFMIFMDGLFVLSPNVYVLMIVFSVLVMLYIFERDNLNPSYKILWMLVMIVFPITGAIFYFLWGNRKLAKSQRDTLSLISESYKNEFPHSQGLLEKLDKQNGSLAKQARYLLNIADSNLYENTQTKYYRLGEDFFVDYLEDLKNAKKSIFIQYFIIDEGEMWDKILEILIEKAKEGVDVRVLYDGFGSLLTLPDNYDETLRKMGIKAHIFSPLKLSTRVRDYLILNNRDHRKITIIDSNIAYGGGLNIGDEYINKIKKFGIWKDTAFRLYGDASFGMTVTFLEAWQFTTGEFVNYSDYKPNAKAETDGIIQPYHDTPLDTHNVCENAYLNVINLADDYVYITTPYLIIDTELITALSLASQSGADVKILVPGIPDKWYAYYITQSYYKTLVENGVEIYEYTPGFVHAKMYVSDDKQAIVGSANMDYRSLYLHYENCVAFYGGSMVSEVKQDFIDCLKDSKKVTLEDIKKTPFLKRLYQIFFKVLSPLM